MRASVGDHLIVEGTRVGDVRRVGVIVALRREDGSPPYVVRWLDDGHEGLVFPGSDARLAAAPAAAPKQGGSR
ncbi:MAG TPA: DUF1918 domain-containing protein [Micromonosporaceae bacterium]